MEIKLDYPNYFPPWAQLALSLLIFGGMMALLIGSCRWAVRDATERGKSGCLIGLLVLFTWPIGLLFWLIARPDVKTIPSGHASQKRCPYPGCTAIPRPTGKILGTATYKCDAGHEFTEPSASSQTNDLV